MEIIDSACAALSDGLESPMDVIAIAVVTSCTVFPADWCIISCASNMSANVMAATENKTKSHMFRGLRTVSTVCNYHKRVLRLSGR